MVMFLISVPMLMMMTMMMANDDCPLLFDDDDDDDDDDDCADDDDDDGAVDTDADADGDPDADDVVRAFSIFSENAVHDDEDDDEVDAMLVQVVILPSRRVLPVVVLRQPRRSRGLRLCLRRRRCCLPLSVGACAPGPPRGACGRGRGASLGRRRLTGRRAAARAS